MLIELLESYKWYDNKFSDVKNHISASSFANETLELWLDREGYDREEKLGDNTVGSLVHIAMEKLVTDLCDPQLVCEKRFDKAIGGYLVSGSMDLIDYSTRTIYDYKTAKNYSRKMLAKEGKNHRYAIQMAIYNWLLTNENESNFTCKIFWIMKDSKAAEREPVFVEEEIEIMSREEIEAYMLEKIAVLDAYDSKTIPDKCSDLWTRKVKSALIDTKCEFYCGFKKTCPKYKTTAVKQIATW